MHRVGLCVRACGAGMLVLCRRAKLGDEELAPEVLLTILW